MATIKFDSWHYHIAAKYTNKDIYTGMSFCKYTRCVLQGLMKILGIIALFAFLLILVALAVPPMVNGHFAEILSVWIEYSRMDVNGIYDFMLAASVFVDLLVYALVIVCGVISLVIMLFVTIGITLYSAYIHYFNSDEKGTSFIGQGTSFVGQWIKSKYEKFCPTIEIKY